VRYVHGIIRKAQHHAQRKRSAARQSHRDDERSGRRNEADGDVVSHELRDFLTCIERTATGACHHP